jgi:hypothetical protein
MYNASILEDAHVLTNLAAFNATLASCRIAVDTIVVLKVGRGGDAQAECGGVLTSWSVGFSVVMHVSVCRGGVWCRGGSEVACFAWCTVLVRARCVV